MEEPMFYEPGPRRIGEKYGLDVDYHSGKVNGLSKYKTEDLAREVINTRNLEGDGFKCYECEDSGCEECKDLPEPEVINGMTLQALLDRMPEGISPKDVTIGFGADCGAFDADFILSFSYRPILDLATQKKLYDADLKVYNKKWKAHLKEKKKYDAWNKAQKKKKLQAQLRKLDAKP